MKDKETVNFKQPDVQLGQTLILNQWGSSARHTYGPAYHGHWPFADSQLGQGGLVPKLRARAAYKARPQELHVSTARTKGVLGGQVLLF